VEAKKFNPYEKNVNYRFLPNKEGKMKPIMYEFPILIGKVELLRAIYPYLKILKDNPYISERNFHAGQIGKVETVKGVLKLPLVCYSYRFDFTPFKKESDTTIRLEFGVCLFSGKVTVNVIREDTSKDDNGINYLSFILFKADKRPLDDLEVFEDKINNIHLNAATIAYESNDPSGFIYTINKFIPDDVLFGSKRIANIVNSAKGVKKYNL